MASNSSITLPGRIDIFVGAEADAPVITTDILVPITITSTPSPRPEGASGIFVALAPDHRALKRDLAARLRTLATDLEEAREPIAHVTVERPVTLRAKDAVWAEVYDRGGRVTKSGLIHPQIDESFEHPEISWHQPVGFISRTDSVITIRFHGDDTDTLVRSANGEHLNIRVPAP